MLFAQAFTAQTYVFVLSSGQAARMDDPAVHASCKHAPVLRTLPLIAATQQRWAAAEYFWTRFLPFSSSSQLLRRLSSLSAKAPLCRRRFARTYARTRRRRVPFGSPHHRHDVNPQCLSSGHARHRSSTHTCILPRIHRNGTPCGTPQFFTESIDAHISGSVSPYCT